jgi:hypothetical protein
MIAAGYLPAEMESKSLEERIEHAYSEVQSDPRVSHGTRHRGPKLSLDAKRVVVEMYENLTGRKLI